jgi:Xaa-Pro aminopeptidase
MLVREKLQQAPALLAACDIDCWITFVRESELARDPMLAYVYGDDVTWHSAFVVCRSGETHAIVGEGDRRTAADKGVYTTVQGYVRDFREPLGTLLRRLAPRTIALNYSPGSEVADGLTHGMFLLLSDLLATLGLADRIVPAERVISRLRGRKSAEELRRLRRAIDEALAIFESARPLVRPGSTELAVATHMQEQARQRGLGLAWSAGTCPAVFTGPEAAEAGLHYGPTARAFEPGHVAYIDFGVRCEEYCSDLQRVYFLAEDDRARVPAEVEHGFETIVRAIERARRELRPGARGLDVDAAARGLIVGRGYAEFPHALGHQVGRFAHDGTALLGPAWEKYAGKPHEPIEEGMVFTIEPRLTVPGRGTVSIEEMVVVTAGGAEYLSPPQTSLIVCR